MNKKILFVLIISLSIISLLQFCDSREDKINKADEYSKEKEYKKAFDIAWDILYLTGSQEKLADDDVARRAKQIIKDMYPNVDEILKEKLKSNDERSINLALFLVYESFSKKKAINLLLDTLEDYNCVNFPTFKAYIEVLVTYKTSKVVKPIIKKAKCFPSITYMQADGTLSKDVSSIVAEEVAKLGDIVISDCKDIILEAPKSPLDMTDKVVAYRILENFKDKDDVKEVLKSFSLEKVRN